MVMSVRGEILVNVDPIDPTEASNSACPAQLSRFSWSPVGRSLSGNNNYLADCSALPYPGIKTY